MGRGRGGILFSLGVSSRACSHLLKGAQSGWGGVREVGSGCGWRYSTVATWRGSKGSDCRPLASCSSYRPLNLLLIYAQDQETQGICERLYHPRPGFRPCQTRELLTRGRNCFGCSHTYTPLHPHFAHRSHFAPSCPCCHQGTLVHRMAACF